MTSEENTYEIYYDNEGDFLEVSFGEPAEEGTTDEIEQGVFVTRDIGSERVTDIGILDFRKRAGLLNEVLKKFNIKLPLTLGVGK